MDSVIKELYKTYLSNPVVCTDSRNIKKGSVFFALKGENFNGNQFAEQALKEGCSYAVIDEDKYKKGRQYFLVSNVLETLQQLANHHRKQLHIPVIAITGSNGKTTSKELTTTVLNKKYFTLATQGNLNNHIGVPLTLLSINRNHQVAVIEMGANHQGEIAALCKIAEPNYGIISNIGRAHLEGFGGFEGVIKAKKEMYDFIKNNQGVLFVNADNDLLMDISSDMDRILYGISEKSDYIGQFIEANPFVKLKWKKITSEKNIEDTTIINTQLVGKYNFENILLAICVGAYFRVDDFKIKEAIEDYVPSNNRSQIVKKNSNTILLDSYNANPTSMAAAIENLSEMEAGNKVLILGDMLELGADSLKEHQLIIDLIQKKNFNKIFLVGKWFSKADNKINAVVFQNVETAAEWLRNNKLANVTVLIKGSRGMKLEKTVDSF